MLQPPQINRAMTVIIALIGILFYLILVHHIADRLGLTFTSEGYLNLFLSTLILVWILLDLMHSSRKLYAFWGLIDRPPEPTVRILRVILLFSCFLFATISALLVISSNIIPTGETEFRISSSAMGPIAILISAFLATLGWSFPIFAKEIMERDATTFDGMQELYNSQQVWTAYERIRKLTARYRRLFEIDKSTPLPLDSMKTTEIDDTDPKKDKFDDSASMGVAIDTFFNALDRYALGVRLGRYSFAITQSTLRKRLIRHAFVYSEYIKQETSAVYDEKRKKFVASNRTWEHLIWLTYHMHDFPEDDIDRNKLVHPTNFF